MGKEKMREDELSRLFGAVADPTRRAILDRLTEGPATVGELAQPFEMTFAAVSKHLRVLEAAGLISRERNAQYRSAHLDAAPLRAASSWLRKYERFWTESFDTLEARLQDGEIASDRRSDIEKGL
jgi:DNA-binding transcriptional ArsR family regulator